MNDSGWKQPCPACGENMFIVREPVYEGLQLKDEKLRCKACGQLFAQLDREPSSGPAQRDIFGPREETAPPTIFADDEAKELCRYCRHYIVNPFRQWCAIHGREVEATDSCARFEK